MERAYYLETGIRCTAACTGTTVFRPSSYREVWFASIADHWALL